MRLIFSDEFNYEGKPDPTKWGYETGNDWHNNEVQYYTDDLKNAYVKDGKLHLVALLEDKGTRHHTSARILTHGKFSFQYGKIEMRAKLPKGKGSWPAFWMMPDSCKEGARWPLCGEIDLMEFAWGADPQDLHFTVHSELYNHKIGTQETLIKKFAGLTDEFHKYTCEWTADSIAYFVDDEHVVTFYKDRCTDGSPKPQTVEAWPFDQPYFLLLNLAVGGMFGGEVDDAQLPYVYEIDYVKVWSFEEEE